MSGPIDPRLFRKAKATRRFLLALIVTGVATGLLVLAQAWLLSQGVAHVFYEKNLDTLAKTVGLVALVFLGRATISWANEWLAHRASASVKSTLRRDIMKARMANPTDPGTSSASLINLTTTNLNDLDGYYSKFLPQLVLAVIVPLMLIIPVYRVDIQSGLIITVTVPLIPIFMVLIGQNTKEQVARRFNVQYRLANHFSDLIQGLPTLQVFGRAKSQVDGLAETEDANRTETMKTLRISFMSAGVLELASTLSVALVAVTIGLRVVYWDLDLYTALFILVIAPEVYLPIRQVGTHFHDSQNGMAAASRAFKIIEAGEVAPKGGITPVPDGPLTVTFEQVRFTYPDANEPVLDDFNFTIRPSQVTALAGKTGAGKSTALALLMGFATPDSGRITVNGVDLAILDLAAWRREIAWVGQTPGMIVGTVQDNIQLGSDQVPPAEIRQVLDEAGGEDLPLDHFVGDDGEGLSAGERRRVGVARALLRLRTSGARLMVLDEPTAGLDADTEASVIAAVRSAGVSVLVVSHRPSVISMAEQVLELEVTR